MDNTFVTKASGATLTLVGNIILAWNLTLGLQAPGGIQKVTINSPIAVGISGGLLLAGIGIGLSSALGGDRNDK
ncbi:MAG: hypothetical protein ACRCYP_01630 [Alphaproteobacteria bacterium]